MVAHPSADPRALAVAVVRGGFEYQGQKCSAASRVYIPHSLWTDVRDWMIAMIREMKMGDVQDFRNFMGAVIDRKAFDKISGYLHEAKKNAKVLAGGGTRGETGYFIEPTLVQVEDPKHRLMVEEIFGPVVTAFVYEDGKWEETLRLVDATSPYGLTGAVFSADRAAIRQAAGILRGAAGNLYINDKPTGAGSKLNLVRWVSARTIKETFSPPRDYRYSFMAEE
jgi:1-pyrroline-5-carboxylate dehydrogenase